MSGAEGSELELLAETGLRPRRAGDGLPVPDEADSRNVTRKEIIMMENSPEMLAALGMDEGMCSVPLYACHKDLYLYKERHMEADGSNVSHIVSRLICTAGRICESYASDIVYDIEALEESVDRGEDFARCLVFYNNGVYSLRVYHYKGMPLIADQNCAERGIQVYLLQHKDNLTTLDRIDFNPLARVKNLDDLEFRYELWDRDCGILKKNLEEQELKDKVYYDYLYREAKEATHE